ncbi:MAG TPA: OmpH family outer membrane protein [Opitutaceae bacterium]|nr:OmpH family outer membrane protein [Opitutaceae bacterium]
MKTVIRSTFAALVLAGATLGLQAEVALKVVTIDLGQLFEKYYKTEAQQEKIREDSKKAKEQFDALVKEREALVTQAKEIQEQAKNPVLSDEARKKAETDFEAKVGEVRSKEGEMQDFNQRIQQLLQQRMAQFQQSAVEEISKVATDIAKQQGASLVLNRGMGVVYADASYDITPAVLEAINKDRPAPAVNVTVPAPAK